MPHSCCRWGEWRRCRGCPPSITNEVMGIVRPCALSQDRCGRRRLPSRRAMRLCCAVWEHGLQLQVALLNLL